ncbi:hypothetical protein [Listeria sp. PSOL-1]|uniref:hypothetical protein n=1 Tax=Listeria sp. PSOL-1 TaxID=1844999 RepID=UPI0013D17874|nr:hypothetical protein [Listeria sp. PSOL-1]
MKKLWIALSTLGIVFLVVGCGSNQAKSDNTNTDKGKKVEDTAMTNENDQQKQGETKALTEQQVLAATKKQIAEKGIALPKQIPLSSSKMHLTATTAGSSASYVVDFFESDKPIPINNEKLKNGQNAKEIGRIEKKTYSSEKAAEEAIGYTDFSKTGAKPVDLGHDIKGYPDAGAGNKYMNWNEGRWALSVHASNINNGDYMPLTKQTVAFLEKESLPIPNKYGSVKLDSEKNTSLTGNQVMWQEGRTVYIVYAMDPMKALQMATNFDKTN